MQNLDDFALWSLYTSRGMHPTGSGVAKSGIIK